MTSLKKPIPDRTLPLLSGCVLSSDRTIPVPIRQLVSPPITYGAIVEVKNINSLDGRMSQLMKFRDDALINPSKKPIVLFTQNEEFIKILSKNRLAQLERENIYVATNESDLIAIVSLLDAAAHGLL